MYIPLILENVKLQLAPRRCEGASPKQSSILQSSLDCFVTCSDSQRRKLRISKCVGSIQTNTINKTKIAGFSLIELMVAVAIIAILAAVAVPSYVNYINKAHLAEIFSAIKQDEGNIMTYAATSKMPSSPAEAAAMLANIGGMAVCNSSYVSNREGDCIFGQYGIRIATDSTKLPDIRINFTPKDVGKMIQWDCTYETATVSAGIEILPLNCRLVTNSTNATALW